MHNSIMRAAIFPMVLIVQMATAQINEEWQQGYNSLDSGWDHAKAMVVDGQGNVIVTGDREAERGNNPDYLTIKYSATGAELWKKAYDMGEDYAAAIAVDTLGNVYVSGTSNGDFATIKYNAAGKQLWVKRYNGTGNGVDGAVAIGVDAAGNVYVTGSSIGKGTGYDYVTIRYDANGNRRWVKRYNGIQANFDDTPADLKVDRQGRVFVTGRSEGLVGSPMHFPTAATIVYDSSGKKL